MRSSSCGLSCRLTHHQPDPDLPGSSPSQSTVSIQHHQSEPYSHTDDIQHNTQSSEDLAWCNIWTTIGVDLYPIQNSIYYLFSEMKDTHKGKSITLWVWVNTKWVRQNSVHQKHVRKTSLCITSISHPASSLMIFFLPVLVVICKAEANEHAVINLYLIIFP